MTLNQALQFLAAGGSVALGSMLISWLAENWPAFKNWDSAIGKQLVTVGVPLVLSLSAWAILTYVPPATLEALSVPFGIAISTIGGVLGKEWWHKTVNKANPTQPSDTPILVTPEATVSDATVEVKP